MQNDPIRKKNQVKVSSTTDKTFETGAERESGVGRMKGRSLLEKPMGSLTGEEGNYREVHY